MTALDPATQRRLIASARLADSNHVGERMAAFEAVQRLLPDGVSLAEVLERGLASASRVSTAPEPADLRQSWAFQGMGAPWKAKARTCFTRREQLNDKEASFVETLAFSCREPSEKQRAWLDDIATRLGVLQ